jgi:hypothetical protein
VRFCRSSGSLCVMGNHECKILSALTLRQTNPEISSKYDCIKELSADDLVWLRELPHTISLPQYNLIAVHAG